MDNNADYNELVIQAQLGDRESVDSLAKLVRGRLYAYAYRIMLQHDLSEDIVQDSLLEMFKGLNKLERTDRFWAWLRRICSNKINRHYGKRHHKTVSISDVGGGDWQRQEQNDSQSALAEVISKELKETVFNAIGGLKQQHRMILVMRCYEEMQYSEIAESMGRSELGVRVLFCRAKKALGKELSRQGFGKATLLTALVIFGKMTAPSQAAAAQISITSSIVGAGVTASLLTITTGKTTVVSVAAAGLLAVGGTMVPAPWLDKTISSAQTALRKKLVKATDVAAKAPGSRQHWYYYPPNANGAVMMQLKSDVDGKQSYCQWLQNQHANYYFDELGNTVYINNSRMWSKDLVVCRLPTDKTNLTYSLLAVEGRTDEMEYISSDENGLLIIGTWDAKTNSKYWQRIHHYNLLEEEYFRYPWPAGVKVVDNRDTMHSRGWTYFTVAGRSNGEEVRGTGRIPFVYAASKRHWPWLRLETASGEKIIDFAGAEGFAGLSRPWMGLHTIDTVRRDAAQNQARFETTLLPGDDKAEVVLTHKQTKLVYVIDMEKDVIDKIAFSSGNGRQGELRFSYLQNIDKSDDDFASPPTKHYEKPPQQDAEMLWLVRLAEGNLH